jgi:hypothetical protein
MNSVMSSYDRRGNVVDEDDAAFIDKPTKFEFLHPEKVTFVD